jgi:serine protease Do
MMERVRRRTSFRRPISATGILFLALTGLLAPAATAGPKTTVLHSRTPVLEREVPESIDDLKAIQEQVKKVLKQVLPATVAVRVSGAQGSGIIINKDGYILTAGHVSGKKGQEATVIFSDGRTVKAKTLGADRDIDSGLLKITDKGPWPYAPMGHSSVLRRGQWCVALGHPGGYKTDRTPVVRVGRILDIYSSYIRTDCALVGGDSGGPVFDLDGKVIGIHSCIGAKITANIHVPVDAYRNAWDRLVRGEVWGKPPRATSKSSRLAYLGIEGSSRRDNCRVERVEPESPADRAGLQVNDVITKFDGQTVTGISDLGKLVRRKKPGDMVTLRVLRDREIIILEVVLGQRDEDE